MPGAGESWLSTCSVSRRLARRHRPTHPQLPGCGREMWSPHSTFSVLLGRDYVISLPVVDPVPHRPGMFLVFYCFYAFWTDYAVINCMAALRIGPLVAFPMMGLCVVHSLIKCVRGYVVFVWVLSFLLLDVLPLFHKRSCMRSCLCLVDSSSSSL